MSTTEPAFDPTSSRAPTSADEIKQAASDSVSAGVDIRQRIHDVTLLALKSRRFDRHGMTEVVQRGHRRHGARRRAKPGRLAPGAVGSVSRHGPGAHALGRSGRRRVAAARGHRQGLVRHRDQAGARDDEKARGRLSGDRGPRGRGGQRADPAGAAANPPYRARRPAPRRARVAAHIDDRARRSAFRSRPSMSRSPAWKSPPKSARRFAQLASGILGGIADALATPRTDKKPQVARPSCCKSPSARCGTSRVCRKSRRS